MVCLFIRFFWSGLNYCLSESITSFEYGNSMLRYSNACEQYFYSIKPYSNFIMSSSKIFKYIINALTLRSSFVMFRINIVTLRSKILMYIINLLTLRSSFVMLRNNFVTLRSKISMYIINILTLRINI